MSKANLRRLRTQESSEVKRAIETLRAQDGFDRCFDCGAESPDWASLAPRALVCHNCSGAHRAAALRIRSLTLDRWSLAEVHLLQQQPSQLRELIDSRANAQERANFVRRKYAEFLPKRKSVVETAPKLTVGADGRIQTRERKESFFATIGRRFRTSSRVVRDTSESEENLNLEDAEDQADLYSFEEPPDRSTLPTQFFGFLFRAGRHNRFRFKQRWLCIDTRNRRISYHHELGGEPREQCDLRGASVSQVRQVSPAWVWNPTTGHYARARRPLFCLTLRAAQLDDTQDDVGSGGALSRPSSVATWRLASTNQRRLRNWHAVLAACCC
ncbi:MAG: hypothetical protein MHM6MM_004232 [Cercozoa sp. M6MM]